MPGYSGEQVDLRHHCGDSTFGLPLVPLTDFLFSNFIASACCLVLGYLSASGVLPLCRSHFPVFQEGSNWVGWPHPAEAQPRVQRACPRPHQG